MTECLLDEMLYFGENIDHIQIYYQQNVIVKANITIKFGEKPTQNSKSNCYSI